MKTLSEIQQKLKAPKNQFNSFGKYNYRSCEDILVAVKPLLDGATLTISDEIINVGDRYYVKATATLRYGEESETVTAFAREEENKKGMDASQITGSASSYARKYALNGLFLIDDTKDADATNKHEDKPKTKPKEDVPDFDEKSVIKNLKTELNSKMGNLPVDEKKDFYQYATGGKESVALLNHIIGDFERFFDAWKKQRDDAA